MFIAGARGSHQFAVERLEQQFVKSARLLVPSREDWVYTGKLLGRLAIKYGYEQIGRGRLTNDALIATSSGRLGIEIVTTNSAISRGSPSSRRFDGVLRSS